MRAGKFKNPISAEFFKSAERRESLSKVKSGDFFLFWEMIMIQMVEAMGKEEEKEETKEEEEEEEEVSEKELGSESGKFGVSSAGGIGSL